ncbi:hypothetical protein [Undibacterium terreum]|uniref:Cofactor-independent phosphoglycerate mutase n=1 Tax=Undibacterium terreum TaxID=1224302 RepID=A0A916UXZ2_9BURK|nr:hypothetical protein [Undibacterium terreum]GGC93229.1 hypothetical protein GCM10011396_45650 [Undibacterium terreum]
MKHIELVLPFAIPPLPLAPDLVRELKVPALSLLISRTKAINTHQFEEFSRQLPHEAVLSGQFASSTGGNRGSGQVQEFATSGPADTHDKMHALGLNPADGHWFTLSPMHIHIARDHLVLTDQRRLELADVESKALFASALVICNELGKELVYGNATTWFLRADEWAGMQTATPDAACGHNIDIWMAKGDNELQWRKLQNEIQMQWFTDKVNTDREMQGMRPVNSVWLWGGSSRALERQAIYRPHSSLESALATKDKSILLDQLLEPALNEDWASWLDQMHALEASWFVPLAAALQGGQLSSLNLQVSDATTLAEFSVSPWSLRKFWIKPSLKPLTSLASQ